MRGAHDAAGYYYYYIHGTNLDCLEFDGEYMYGYMPIYLPGVVSLMGDVDYLWQLSWVQRTNELAVPVTLMIVTDRKVS